MNWLVGLSELAAAVLPLTVCETLLDPIETLLPVTFSIETLGVSYSIGNPFSFL
ncbi:hypothetical protein MTR80_06840 [Alcaligenes aquatilis]|uniref:Uncharacterized protein n=1 Tax=Alcaligenes aquatilis TaxID=323284 RepID=A0ABY4NLA1_9BURK|nr:MULTISPECIES: hypothetical protein [Alcaligenes]QXR37390.1 hypothetical protein EGK70_007840 [Alcaligenes aquatilis]UQN37416.1 hypothetical protein MTR80_06840 [Alcaligenes aquatilis]